MKKIILIIAFLLTTTQAQAADFFVTGGSTGNIIELVVDASAGGRFTTLAFNSGSLVCQYHRQGAANSVAISTVDMTVGTWVSGGLKKITTTVPADMSGHYELGLPDAAVAAGAKYVTVTCGGVTGMNSVSVLVKINPTVSVDRNSSW